MVRTHSPAVPLHIDASRVLGWSTALAVHVLALMLLLIPATQPLTSAPRERMQVRWMETPAPTPPVPVPVTAEQALPKTPTVPVAAPRPPAPLPAPTALLEQVPALAALPASEVATPSIEPAAPAAAPLQGVQLQYRSAPPPPYPIQAIRQGQQGTVVLRIRVGVDGKPVSVAIETSSGSRVLDQAARQQVLRYWQFVPATVDGQRVQADGLVPVEFSLPR